MYRVKYYLACAKTLIIFLPLLAVAELFFDAFYPIYNVILLFLILSSAHNLLNKQIMIRNLTLVDIAAFVMSAALVFVCGLLNMKLYTSTLTRGVLILICMNQLFMISRNNYKERVSVRKGNY